MPSLVHRYLGHSVEVSAESVYEAVGLAVHAFREIQDEAWGGDLPLTRRSTVRVHHQVASEHSVDLAHVLEWTKRHGTPREVMRRRRVAELVEAVVSDRKRD